MRIGALFALLILALLGMYTAADEQKVDDVAPVNPFDAAETTEAGEEEFGEEEEEIYDMDEAELTSLLEAATAEENPLSETELKELTSWAGHLKPLGSANEKIALKEISEFPSPKDFYSQYVIKSEPVVIRGGVAKQLAFSKWTDEHFKSIDKADKLRVYVENGRKENRTNSGVELPDLPFFVDYVSTYSSADKFMITDILPALKSDITLPTSIQCPLLKDSFMRALVYPNGGNTKSVLHHEHYEDIHCIVAGSKSSIFANPATNQEHIFIDADDAEAGEYVAVDVDAVDATKYPGMRKVVFYNAELTAGDCVYIPSTWMQADSTKDGRNVAVSLWWARDEDVDEKIMAGACIAEGEWSLDKLILQDEVTTLMLTDEERQVLKQARGGNEEESDEEPEEVARFKDEL